MISGVAGIPFFFLSWSLARRIEQDFEFWQQEKLPEVQPCMVTTHLPTKKMFCFVLFFLQECTLEYFSSFSEYKRCCSTGFDFCLYFPLCTKTTRIHFFFFIVRTFLYSRPSLPLIILSFILPFNLVQVQPSLPEWAGPLNTWRG